MNRNSALRLSCSPYNTPNSELAILQDGAVITIGGSKLTDSESKVVRIAIDALASVLGEGLGFKHDDIPLTDQCMTSLSRIQALSGDRQAY
jgi:hypothetical protein